MPPSTTATCALLDRARSQISFERVCRYVGPSDPGWIESAGQMTAIWSEGQAAVADSIDWEPLLHALGDHGPANPKSFVWYRLMAASAALLCDDDMLMMSAHYYLARAISDTMALRAAGEPEAPADLVPNVCRERARRPDAYPEARLFALLGALVTAGLERSTPDDIVMLCRAVARIEQALRAAGAYASPEYVWGITRFDSYHALWLALIRDHFPTHVPEAVELRESLLTHGARWAGGQAVDVQTVEDGEQPEDRSATRYSLAAIAFFLRSGISDRARAVALRLAEDGLGSVVEVARSDDRFSSWLSAMNNAIHAALASGALALAARWADIATPYARDNPYLPHNLACAFAAVGRTDDAFAMCVVAVEMGNPGLEELRDDEDLGSLRSEPRFVALFGGRGS